MNERVYACVQTYPRAQTHLCVHMHSHTCAHTRICTYMYVCKFVHMHTCIHTAYNKQAFTCVLCVCMQNTHLWRTPARSSLSVPKKQLDVPWFEGELYTTSRLCRLQDRKWHCILARNKVIIRMLAQDASITVEFEFHTLMRTVMESSGS
jgi:hypothetical protein